jgi:hypothetical protein
MKGMERLKKTFVIIFTIEGLESPVIHAGDETDAKLYS